MKRSEASYTIEAVVLIPIILAVIVALIQICFVFHDRVIVREALEYIALTTEGDETIETAFEEHLLLSEVKELQITELKKEIRVFAKLRSKILIPFLPESSEGIIWECSTGRKKAYAREKTMISEVVLDTLHLFQ